MFYDKIPNDVLHIILEYYGRIKYKKGVYVNIISKNDDRYSIIHPIIIKKLEILKETDIDGKRFYFEFEFTNMTSMGLCYDYNWSYDDKFEICYFNFRNKIEELDHQKRTLI